MSSSGPYQSRLFNFLNQQSIRFADQCNRALRHVKIAGVWGVQVVLYPVYLLVQATRFAGQQLQQAAQQHSPQLPPPGKSTNKTPPEADRPIQQVLQAVATWELAAVKNGKESSSLTLNSQLSFPIPNPDGDLQNLPDLQNCLPPFPIPNIEIQGVAALIETRSLVLVTTENQILDILNPQQQQKLQQQIILEVAEYWHQWRIFLSFGQGFKAKLQPPPATRSRVLPPVRFFWSMMAWVQRGQVAIAANLFQESTLVKTGHGEASNQSFNSESTNYNLPLSTFILDQLEVLDRAIAELETNPLRPGEELTKAIAHRTQELLQGWGIGNNPLQPTEENESLETNRVKIWDLMQAAIAHFFGKGNEKLIEPDFPEPSAISASTPIEALPSDNSAALSTVPSANLKSTSSSPRSPAVTASFATLLLGIYAIIKAAIDYFLGKHPQELSGDRPTASAIPVNPEQETNQLNGSEATMALAAAKEEDPWLNSIDPDGNQDGIVQKLTRRITEKKKRNPKSSSNRAKPQHHHQRNQPVSKTPSGQNSAPFVNQPAALTTKSDPHPQQKSEWIETEATPAGYVKHPLEKLLELLDGTMFWLEDLLVKIWRWIKQI